MFTKNLVRAALIGALVLPGLAVAAVPTTMTQQGRLLTEDGAPVTGSKSIRFIIYDAPTGGAILWESDVEVTFDETGFYTAVLGDNTNPLDAMVFAEGAAYLTMAVDGGAEMSPRQPVTAVPYAQVAGSVAPGSIDADALASGLVLDPSNLPADLADGDDDALGGITCNQGQVAGWGTSGWECVDVLTSGTTTLSSLSCGTNQVAGYNGTGWVCLDWVSPSATLAGLSCTNGQVAIYTNGVWACGNFPTPAWANITGIPASLLDGDQDTTYSAGTGLTLNGTTFSFNSAYTVPNASNAGTLDNLDSTEFFRLSANNTVAGATTFNNDVTINGVAHTQAKRVYRDKAGTIPPAGQVTTYQRRAERLHLVNSRRQETLQIPHTDLVDLCGDEDGCTMSVSMRKWGNTLDEDVQANALGRVHFSYNGTSGKWRFSEDAAATGRDGDSVETNRNMGWDCCYISDFEYISAVGQNDGARSMYLLNWTSATCPLANNLECHMTIDD